MLKLAADENFDGRIIRGLIHRVPSVDIQSVQDVEMNGADDPAVLQWAADEDRVLLTHDADTMTYWAYQRITAGQNMPGLVQIDMQTPVGPAVDALEVLVLAGEPTDCDGKVLYLPF